MLCLAGRDVGAMDDEEAKIHSEGCGRVDILSSECRRSFGRLLEAASRKSREDISRNTSHWKRRGKHAVGTRTIGEVDCQLPESDF
jgi:hypothetical protein